MPSPETGPDGIPLFRLAFRPFFLFGALFAAIAMAVWISVLNGWWSKGLYGGGFFWHVHEMLFGFVAAVITGFLLTAVQNWTGERSLNGAPLAILFAMWATARLGFLFVEAGNVWLATLDISFLLVAAVFLALPIVRVKQWRNLFFAPVLVLFALANGMMHLGVLNQNHALTIQGTRAVLFLVCVLMVTIGGRVIPVFTANGTGTQRVESVPALEIAALGSVWLLAGAYLLGLHYVLGDVVLAAILMLAAVTNFVRWVRWRFWITLRVPLLWTLHLAYFFLVVGFTTLAVCHLARNIAPSIGWHLVTVGGMGGLILSMISRVSLGHTGRMIIAPRWMVPAFAGVFVAAILRTFFVAVFASHYVVWITVSGALWVVAFLIFATAYSPILSRPRLDNRTDS